MSGSLFRTCLAGCAPRFLVGAVIVLSFFSDAGEATAAEQAGVASVVRGHVEVAALGGEVGKVLRTGMPIYLGDQILSGADSDLQILLLDETVFSLGPNSAIEIDEFVYSPTHKDGRLTARIIRGTFRFISGRIAEKNPENMTVTIPTATIGIRGTIAAGRVQEKESVVLLLGPGSDNNTNSRIGKIIVSSANGEVILSRPGWGTFLRPGEEPTAPELMPEVVLAGLNAALAVRGGAGESGEAEASGGSLAGEDTARGEVYAEVLSYLTEVEEEHDEDLETLADEANEAHEAGDSLTTLQQLLSLGSGVFHYAGSGGFSFSKINNAAPPVRAGSEPTANFSIDINFGSRAIGGGNSAITIVPGKYAADLAGHTLTTSVGTISYAGGGLNPASIDLNSYVAAPFSTSKLELKNSGGTIAVFGHLDVEYNDVGNGTVGSADLDSLARESGLTP